MTAKVFVDTNVLVYARDSSEPDKQPAAAAWMRHLWETRSGCLSMQVLQEFYMTVTRKLEPGLSPAAARLEVQSLLAWEPLPIDTRVLTGAWELEDRLSLSWWDALIVAAAKVAGANKLLTEDLQEGLQIDGVLVVSPFRGAPS